MSLPTGYDFYEGPYDYDWRRTTPAVSPGAATPPSGGLAPPGQVQITPGYTPDYASMIRNDPGYLGWQNASRLTHEQAEAQRRAALRQLAIRFGGSAPGMQDVYGDIDENTLALARQNQFSDLARLARSYEEGVTGLKKGLAGRGMLQSGETQWGLNQADYQRGAGEYELGNAFLDAANQQIGGYNQVRSQLMLGEVDQLQAALERAYASPAGVPSSGSFAQHLGGGVYQGPDGQQYTLGPDGQLVPSGGGGGGMDPTAPAPAPDPATEQNPYGYQLPPTGEWWMY
jgi:hypothetical protein